MDVAVRKLILHHPPALQVVLEQATGAVDLEFLHTRFTNAYINLTNVVLVLTPTAAKKDTPAVLLNAHFDSTLGSPGLSRQTSHP